MIIIINLRINKDENNEKIFIKIYNIAFLIIYLIFIFILQINLFKI